MPRRKPVVSSSSSSSESESSSSSSYSSWSSSSSSSEEEEKRPRKKAKMAVPLQTAPIMTMSQLELREALTERVKYQEAAMNLVASEMWHAMQPRRPSEGDQVRVVTALLSGVSGTGKTLTCERLRQLMLTGRGQQYEAQFVESHLAGVSEVGATKFSGCGAGWQGYGSVSFADQFKRAVQPVGDRPPPYIFIQMDELDKCSGDALPCLNSLLDRGQIELTSEMVQIRPHPDTVVIVFFTANYGAEKLLQCADTMTAVSHIKSDMRKNRVNDCDIGRLGCIVPFRGFTEQQMSGLFHSRLSLLIREHALSECGVSLVLRAGVTDALCQTALNHYDARLGVRDAMKLFTREVTHWLDMIHIAVKPGDTAKQLAVALHSGNLWLDHVQLASTEYFTNAERLQSHVKEFECEHRFNVLVTATLKGSVVSRFVLL